MPQTPTSASTPTFPRPHFATEIELLDPDFDSTLDTTDLDLRQFSTTLHYYEQPQLPEENLP